MPDKQDIARRFARALPSYEQHATAQAHIAERLLAVVHTFGRQYGQALEIGCGSGLYSRLLHQHLSVDCWHINDLCAECADRVPHGHFIAGDIEQLSLPQRYDLITSASAFQWLAEPETFSRKLHASLNPGGVLAFSSFTADNLPEIHALTGNSLAYPSPDNWQTWLGNNGLIPAYTASECLTLWFDSPEAVLAHLKYTGVTALAKQHWTKATLQDFSRRYRTQYEQNGRVPLSYHPFYLAATKAP